jgi:hypothetical protein
MKKLVWLSYDLSITGDYGNLYQWLDEHEAVECGDCVACFKYKYKTDLKKELQKDLNSKIKIDPKKDRLYLISPKKDDNGQEKYFGTFLFGRRKATPWIGYAVKDSLDDDDT